MSKDPKNLSVIEIATHRELREADRKQWLRFSPGLLAALGSLAKQDGVTLERLLSDLIVEALTHRTLIRPFKPMESSEEDD